MISVTVGTPDSSLTPQWNDLIQRAPGNAFMNPAALKAACDTMFAFVHVLLAFDHDFEPARLVGMWALQQRSVMPFWPSLLEARPFNYAFLSTPVIAAGFAHKVIPAFFAAIKDNPALPKVVSLKEMDADSQAFSAIRQTLANERHANLTLTQSMRPVVSREAGLKTSGSTRKKLRQDWNRLSALGALEVVNERTVEGASAAFEEFLDLELKSWKGAEGTAILCDDHHAAFTRRLIADLVTDGSASVALLKLDGKAVAAQVMMYCGTTAYTWKTAFDASFAKYSPGVLVIDRLTEQLFATTSIQSIDSCATENSFMGQLWTGRRAMVDMVVDVGSGPSFVFVMEAARQLGYEKLRMMRDRLRLMPLMPARRRLAPSP